MLCLEQSGQRFQGVERTNEEFIKTVKDWSQKTGTTQATLSKRLGVSTSLTTEWFKGRRYPVSEEVLHLQEIMREKN